MHPGAITPHDHFKASIYVLKKEEGGRHTPFGNKYRPQFYLRTMDCTGEIKLPEGVEMPVYILTNFIASIEKARELASLLGYRPIELLAKAHEIYNKFYIYFITTLYQKK